MWLLQQTIFSRYLLFTNIFCKRLSKEFRNSNKSGKTGISQLRVKSRETIFYSILKTKPLTRSMQWICSKLKLNIPESRRLSLFFSLYQKLWKHSLQQCYVFINFKHVIACWGSASETYPNYTLTPSIVYQCLKKKTFRFDVLSLNLRPVVFDKSFSVVNLSIEMNFGLSCWREPTCLSWILWWHCTFFL